MNKYSKVRVTNRHMFTFRYRVEGFDGKKWETLSYHDFLWAAKRKADKCLKEPQNNGIFYEVSN